MKFYNILLIMKLTFVLVISALLQVSAETYAQKIELHRKNATIKSILEEIREQSGYDYFFDTRLIRHTERVDINVSNATVAEVLSLCFDGQPLTYTIENKIIVIKEKQMNLEDRVPGLLVAAADTLRGTITDTAGIPLPGVSVIVKGTQNGTSTDVNGNYALNRVPDGAIIVYSLLGFQSLEVPVADRRIISISLAVAQDELDEIVVVGYGTQKKRDIIGAISSISSEQMDNYPGGSFNTSLQGKVAGLNITVNSGEPGSGAVVTLRGVSSINGSSQPLYVIDGMPIDPNSYSSLNDNATFSPLNDLNPQDIESIEVLKDGASASIYGSRASNGVIIITTKSGRSITPQIGFSANTSINNLTRAIGVLNGPQWREAYSEAIYNQGGVPTAKKSVIDSLHPYYRESHDWQHIMFQESIQSNIDVSASGSSKDKSLSYYVSFGYRHLPPISFNTKYEQQLGTVRLNYTISKRITGATNFNISNYDYQRVRTGINSRSVVFQNFVTMPVYGPFDPITGEIVPLFDGTKKSPYAIAMFAKDDISRWRVLARQELNFNLMEGLDFNTSVALDFNNTESSSFDPPILRPSNSSQAIKSDLRIRKDRSLVTENTLTYQRTVNGNHHFSFLLGQSYEIDQNNSVNLRGIDFIDDQISTINGASSITSFGQNLSDNALLSYFTRLNYDYKSRYLVSLVLRRDGSSRFGQGMRFGYFPSISAGWRFSDEPFLKNFFTSFLYDGKIRASYGTTGNQQIGDYASQGSYSRAGSYLGGLAIASSALPNTDLRWETTKQSNLGLDLTFMEGRLTFNADAYIKESSNLLFYVQIPVESGYNNAPMNYGGIENKGIELALSGIIIDKEVKWDAVLTYGLNRNKVTSLPNNDEDYRPNPWNLARVGQPVGVFYGLKAKGVYSRDEDNVYKTDPSSGDVIPYRKGTVNGLVYKGGDVIWDDKNGDGVINDDDLQIIGNPNPEWTGGIQNTVSYKRFTLNAFVNISYGNQVFNELKRQIDASTTDANYSTDQLRRWKMQGDVTDVPRLIKGDPMQNNVVSTRFVEDASYVRLQLLSLNYQLPGKTISKIGLRNASLGFSCINLLTFSRYTGYDPEVSASSDALGLGVDNGAFPKSRAYSLSLNVKF